MTLFNFSRHNILLDATLTPKVADFGFVTPMPVNGQLFTNRSSTITEGSENTTVCDVLWGQCTLAL